MLAKQGQQGTEIGYWVGFFVFSALILAFIPTTINSLGLTPPSEDINGSIGVLVQVTDVNVSSPLVPNFVEKAINTPFQFINDFLTAWSVVPTPITLVLLTAFIAGLIYAIIKMLPTT